MKKAVIYISKATTAFDEAAIASLTELAAKENRKHKISGYLFFSKNKFLQYIEGEQTVLDQLIQNISKDNRHQIINLIEDNTLKHYRFLSGICNI